MAWKNPQLSDFGEGSHLKKCRKNVLSKKL